MKKILSVLLSLLLLCSCIPLGAVQAATAATVYGTVDQNNVAPGDTFTMSVQMENNPGLVCWLIDVGYDSAALELVSQTKGDAFSGIGTFSFGPMGESTTNALWYDFLSSSDYTNNGNLFSLTFRVKEDAPAGNYPVTLYCSDWDNMCNMAFERVDFDFVSPTVTVAAAEEPECQHEYFYACDAWCMLCGEYTNPGASHNVIAVESKAATCVEIGNIAYWFCELCGSAWLDAECTQITNLMAVQLPALDHAYDDAYDADCNACGETRDVPDVPVVGSEATLDFHDKANRVSYSTVQQVWQQNGITFTNDKAASASNVGDYGGEGFPVRCYKASAVTIEYPGMAQIVFNCNDYKASYVTDLVASITDGAVTVNGTAVTVTFDAPVDSMFIPELAAQVRLDSITVYTGSAPSFDGFVTNGDFETGDITGWEIWQFTTIDSGAAYEGNYGAHLQGNGDWGGLLNQTIPVQAGNTYEVSFRIQVNAIGVNMQIRDGDWNGANLAGDWYDAWSYGAWSEVAYTVTADSDALYLNFCGSGTGMAEDAYVDAIWVSEVTEHLYDSAVTVSPTCSTEGLMTYTCVGCGRTYTEVIPATGVHTYSNTMDTSCNVCGAIRVIDATIGDTNNDGKINVRDLGLLQQYLNHWDSPPVEGTADVAADGRISVRDLGLLQQYINGWDVELGAYVGNDYAASSAYVYGSTDKNTVEEGEEFVYTVIIRDNPGLAGWHITVDFDASALELVQISGGDAFPYRSLTYGPMTGPTGVTYADFVSDDVTATGTLFSMRFKVKQGAALGAYTIALSTQYEDNFSTLDYKIVPVTIESASVSVVAHMHIYGSTVTKAPTCGAQGVMTYTCDECGDSYTEVIPATGEHSYDNACDAKCNVCGIVRDVPGHSFAGSFACVHCGYVLNLTSDRIIYGTADLSTVAPGDTFTVTVNMANNPGLVGWIVDLDYDMDALEIVRFAQGNAFAGGTMAFGPTDKLPTNALWYDFLNPDVTANGCLFSITFRVKEGAAVGSSVIRLYCEDADNICNDDYENVSFDFVSAVVDVIDHHHTYDNACDANCNVCDEVREVEPHNYVGVVTIAPTCVVDGIMTYTCSACGDSYTEAIPCNGEHDYVGVVTIAPTCGAQGVMTYTCSACGDCYTDAIPATGKHTYVGEVTAPDCINGGYTTYTCSVCAHSYVDDVTAPLGHNYQSAVTIAPTCGAQGIMTYTCSTCGDSYTEAIPATGKHTYESEVTVAPTCVAEGVLTYTCSVCADSYTEAIPATGEHTYDHDCDADCNVCGGIREVPGHSFVNSLTCRNCGYILDADSDAIVQGSVDLSEVAPGDTFILTVNMANNPGLSGWQVELDYDMTALEMIEQRAGDAFSSNGMSFGPMVSLPTRVMWYDFLSGDTTANGTMFYITFRVKEGVIAGDTIIKLYCIDPDNFTTADEQTIHFDFVSPMFTLLDHHHAYDNACDATCNVCGAIREVEPHDYRSVITTAPTCGAEGVMTYTCSVCGDVYTEAIPATGEHIYNHVYDADCDLCGFIREVKMILGDVNGDGKVNIRDVGMLQQYMNGWEVEFPMDVADVNGDGKVNIRDVGLYQQWMNGWEVDYPIGQQ